MKVNEIIAKRRAELGLTLEDIALHVGVSKSTVMKWESGFIKNMRRDKMAPLAEVLKIPPTELLDITGTITPNATSSTPAFQFSNHEQELIKKYRALPAPVQKTIDDLIDLQYEAVKPKVEKDTAI